MNMDSSGKINYRHYFEEAPGRERFYSSFSNVIKVDQEYVGLGAIGVNEDDIQPLTIESKAILIKFSASGNLNWKRIYKTIEGIEASDLYDFDLTKDKGYIMCGLGAYSTKLGGIWRSMLLKVDSFGCLVPGCHLTDNTEIINDKPVFKIFPNPGADFLAVYNPLASTANIILYNLKGEVIMNQSLIQNETGLFDVNDLVSGTYIISAQVRGKKIWSEKWIKE